MLPRDEQIYHLTLNKYVFYMSDGRTNLVYATSKFSALGKVQKLIEPRQTIVDVEEIERKSRPVFYFQEKIAK